MLRPFQICPACRSCLISRSGSFRSRSRERSNTFSSLALINDQLLNLHNLTALPWSIVVPLSTLLLSCVTFPIAYKSRQNQVLMTALGPIIQSTNLSLRQQLSKQDLNIQRFEAEMKRLGRIKAREIKRRHKVTVPWLLLPVAVKLPIWLSFSLTLRAMSGSAIPYFTAPSLEPSLKVDPAWWATISDTVVDLTTPDSLMALPFLFSLITLLNLELQAAQTPTSRNKLSKVLENAGRVVAIVMIPIAGQMPAIVCEYWVTSATLNLLQNLYLSRIFPKSTLKEDKDGEVDNPTVERLQLPGIDDLDQDSSNDTSSHPKPR